jgi:hypothetical protein
MRPTLLALLVVLAFSPARAEDPVAPGTPLVRKGDEIVVAGQLFHTGTPVVLWTDPGGYDAYRVERRFGPIERAGWKESQEDGLKSPARFGMRSRGLSPEEIERVRGGGWDLPLLQRMVDQFVIHYDVCGISRTCFRVLHDERCLSVHFMLDADGTIYQTMDLKESAWHATTSNQRSIGIEIAHIGAYPPGKAAALDRWYGVDEAGKAILTIPGGAEKAGLRNPAADLHPARNEPVIGTVQGTELKQYDYTDAQYEALIRLTATLCTVFPKIKCDYPRDSEGKLVPKKLPDDVYANYGGLMGHYHVQTNKTDPGPAFDWERLVNGARGFMKPGE